VDRFREEEILSRPAFRGVASELRDGGRVAPAALLAATASYLACLDAGNVEVAVMDALLPFIPSLLAWGHDAAALAISRAVRREPPGWLAWLVERYAAVRCGGPVATRRR